MTKIGIAVFPGSNCDRDVHYVLNNILKVQADFIWHTKDRISNYDAIILPGGFAYGDHLRAGIIAAYSPIVQQVKKLAKKGVPVLGICNGFQILVEAGLLPGALMTNASLNFVCKWTYLIVRNNKTPFTNRFQRNQKIRIPIAHGEGRFVANEDTLKALKKRDQIVLSYYKDNPNGSSNFIAAICNQEGNVMGIMPHPERASENLLSPEKLSDNGIDIFNSLLFYLNHNQKVFSSPLTASIT
jgi:phosphoribosylformylglycinamidine synthase subunit PurQ / glutaminase